MTIEHCENSTLRETWFALVGMPGPLDFNLYSALQTTFQRTWAPHEVQQRLLDTPRSAAPASAVPEEVAPFWFTQLTWDEGAWATRWGHNVLVLAHSDDADGSYQTFTETMEPTAEKWFKVVKSAHQFAGNELTTTKLEFSYTNVFVLPEEVDDLSQWFRFNFSVEAMGADSGLQAITVAARIAHPEQSARVTIQLDATADGEAIHATIRTTCELDFPEPTTLSDSTALFHHLKEARTLAKETFFSFVTDDALDWMKAKR